MKLVDEVIPVVVMVAAKLLVPLQEVKNELLEAVCFRRRPRVALTKRSVGLQSPKP